MEIVSDPPVSLQEVLITSELSQRPSRPPDYAAENAALVALATTMAETPEKVLQKLADTALQLCRAGSAGVSVYEPDGTADVFRWRATAGAYKQYLGGTMPRALSPCGTVLDHNAMQLMAKPVRYYPDIAALDAPIYEVLLVPFYQGEKPIGTVWVVKHTPNDLFDAEDARIVTVLTRFAGASVQTLYRIDVAEKAERARQDAQTRLETTLTAGEVATWTWDILADRVIADRNLSRLFSVSQADAPGLPINRFLQAVHPEDLPQLEQLITRSIQTGELFEARYRVRDVDGEYRCLVARGQPQYDKQGHATHLPGVAVDITKQDRAETALRKVATDLAEAVQRKDEFLATLAHELRNPLAPIRNGLSVMRMGSLNADQSEVVGMMERQLTQLVHLVNDLLDVSRVTTGKVMLRRERSLVRGIVEAAVETNRPLMQQTGNSLEIRLPGEPVAIDADAPRIAQVITNLLNNSAKYTPRGGKVVLTVKQEEGQAVIQVADNGVGIPPELLPKVFDMFMQVGTSLERSQGGLGLGLTLVRKLVEMHGGSVAATSAGTGQGSTFTIRLPLAEPVFIAATEGSAGAAAMTPAAARRILVVEDNVDGADTLSMLLRLGGHEVQTAYTGPAGLDLARQFQPDLVLLDIGLPGMNGYEVAQQLRKERGTESLVLVALSGWGREEDRAKAREAGFDQHLTKPVAAGQVSDLIANLPRI